MALIGNKYHVYIETSEGYIYDIDCLAVAMDVRNTYGGLNEWTITLEGLGGNISRGEMVKQRNAPEWVCTYCRRPNSRSQETCASCGAVRSFIYG
jgi:hypothetical protein